MDGGTSGSSRRKAYGAVFGSTARRADLVKVAEVAFAVTRGVSEQRHCAGLLIIHDVAQRPAPARPQLREIPRGDLPVIIEARPQPLERHVNRRRQPRARRLRQNSQARVIMPRKPAPETTGIVNAVEDHAALALRNHFPSHRCAERVDARRDRRVNVRLPRFKVRRHEEAGGRRAHLMHVVQNLRMQALRILSTVNCVSTCVKAYQSRLLSWPA